MEAVVMTRERGHTAARRGRPELFAVYRRRLVLQRGHEELFCLNDTGEGTGPISNLRLCCCAATSSCR
jgi:hypothetical protein